MALSGKGLTVTTESILDVNAEVTFWRDQPWRYRRILHQPERTNVVAAATNTRFDAEAHVRTTFGATSLTTSLFQHALHRGDCVLQDVMQNEVMLAQAQVMFCPCMLDGDLSCCCT